MVKILSVDYGLKRVGIAVSDELGLVATPLVVLNNDKNLLFKIGRIIKEKKITKVIVGIPNWDSKSYVVDKIKEFVVELKKNVGIEVEFVNEYYSTCCAVEKIHQIGKNFKSVKDKLDSYAACEILQSYLEKLKQE